MFVLYTKGSILYSRMYVHAVWRIFSSYVHDDVSVLDIIPDNVHLELIHTVVQNVRKGVDEF